VLVDSSVAEFEGSDAIRVSLCERNLGPRNKQPEGGDEELQIEKISSKTVIKPSCALKCKASVKQTL
jgi:hypothetical protein